MANIIHQSSNVTVNDIAARNAITQKYDNMVATVVDAIADPEAGSGTATYRWNKQLDRWILLSKSTFKTMNFNTDELLITDGVATLLNSPTDNKIWDISIVEGDVILSQPRMEDLIITASSIGGLSAWDGKKIRFTYAYGDIEPSLNSYIDEKVGTGTSLSSNFITTNINGSIRVTTGTAKWFARKNITLTEISGYVQTAPVGSSIIIDVLKNNTVIGSYEIPDGQFIGALTVISVPMIAGDYLTTNITQVGSLSSGANMTLNIEYI